MAVNIEDAGFEIRDMIAWVYGSGFPKSHNLKGEWEGFGTALKPALEPITVARKPFQGHRCCQRVRARHWRNQHRRLQGGQGTKRRAGKPEQKQADWAGARAAHGAQAAAKRPLACEPDT
jgi:hypothetical protein